MWKPKAFLYGHALAFNHFGDVPAAEAVTGRAPA
jgi:hypothetical protein